MSPRSSSLLLSLAALSLLPLAAHANVITFNDLPGTTIGTHMPDLYQGFNFLTTDWFYMTAPSAPADTFLALAGNGTFFIAAPANQDFFLDSVDVWSRRGLDAAGRFYFVLYNDGNTVYNGPLDNDGRQNFTDTHTTFTPNYSGPIDGFAFAFDSNGLDWNHLALDNVTFHTANPVPEPASLALLSLAALPLLRRNPR